MCNLEEGNNGGVGEGQRVFITVIVYFEAVFPSWNLVCAVFPIYSDCFL